MGIGLYPRLACDGIKKNRRLYLPYLLSYTGMIMMYYIIVYLATSETLREISQTGQLNTIMAFGSWIVAVFSVIFLFYTNSFVIRKRKKEFGLYNILGMGKRHLSLIIFWETLISAFITFVAGLFFGIVFSKLAELVMVSLIGSAVTYTMSVSVNSIIMTAVVFGIIFVLLSINSIRQVRFSTALALLKSESTGERPPKNNWFFGVLGLIFLAAGYYLAITVAGPSDALMFFFIAVILVIIGTYLLMISGSVFLCRILKHNKKYYYKPNHFVSVSSMVFRMKRNGAGLASICILSTMVLVMLSTFICLYKGVDSSIRTNYPRDIEFTFFMKGKEFLSDKNLNEIEDMVISSVKKDNAESFNTLKYSSGHGQVTIYGNEITSYYHYDPYVPRDDLYAEFYLFDIDDYNRISGSDISLEEDEALLYTQNFTYDSPDIYFDNDLHIRIKEHIDEPFPFSYDAFTKQKLIYLVVPDITKVPFDCINSYSLKYLFDVDLDAQREDALADGISNAGSPDFEKAHGIDGYWYRTRGAARVDFLETYAALFFLGVILSIVFLCAAVLIIYYKQLSEGYEDRSRFEIMQKVGMTKKEIRKSVNSQLLTVFYLPLTVAACHLAFAFPMISKMLMLFGLRDMRLFACITALCFAVFAIFYGLIIYKATSKTYYNIVKN